MESQYMQSHIALSAVRYSYVGPDLPIGGDGYSTSNCIVGCGSASRETSARYDPFS